MGIIGWLLFAGLVGWIASKFMGTDAEQGILLNVIIGIVGAVVSGFLWGFATNDPTPYQFFDIGSWVTAIIGACILVVSGRAVQPARAEGAVVVISIAQ